MERKQQQQKDQARLVEIREKKLLQAVINAVPTPIFFKDAEGRYLGCNRAFENYIGKSSSELIGRGVFELFEESLAQVYYEADKSLFDSGGHQVYEAQVEYADGSIRDVVFHKAVFEAEDENIDGIVGAILDITERKRAEEMYRRMAFTDALTGLDNRLSMMRDLEHALDRTLRTDKSLALLLLDLDRFKEVNDTHGHPAGDEVLREVARRLRQVVRKSDLVSRLGGDEFAIVIEDITGIDQVLQVAEKVIKSLSSEIRYKDLTLSIGTSIGIALVPEHADDIETLIRYADMELYRAKAEGRNRYSLYSV